MLSEVWSVETVATQPWSVRGRIEDIGYRMEAKKNPKTLRFLSVYVICMPSKNTKSPQCPKCRSDRVIPIMYGDPVPEAWAAAGRGELQLGGCCVSDGMPIWHCTKCGHEFGKLKLDDDLNGDDLDAIISSVLDK
jgi:hypothetical protein